ncbi:hypothetical protein HDV05_000665, partial [Chytridiales sp. JEL 0842]
MLIEFRHKALSYLMSNKQRMSHLHTHFWENHGRFGRKVTLSQMCVWVFEEEKVKDVTPEMAYAVWVYIHRNSRLFVLTDNSEGTADETGMVDMSIDEDIQPGGLLHQSDVVDTSQAAPQGSAVDKDQMESSESVDQIYYQLRHPLELQRILWVESQVLPTRP